MDSCTIDEPCLQMTLLGFRYVYFTEHDPDWVCPFPFYASDEPYLSKIDGLEFDDPYDHTADLPTVMSTYSPPGTVAPPPTEGTPLVPPITWTPWTPWWPPFWPEEPCPCTEPPFPPVPPIAPVPAMDAVSGMVTVVLVLIAARKMWGKHT